MIGYKTQKRFLVLLVGTLVSAHCFSQQDSGKSDMMYPDNKILPAPAPPQEIFYKGSLEAGGGLVYPVTNKALRLSLGGVYYLHFSGNYVLAPHVFGGLELEDTQLGNTASNASFNTLMYMYSVGVKGGYYTFMQNDFLIVYSLSVGPTLIYYDYPPNPAPKGGFRQQSFFITPNWLAGYRVNNELRIGLEISYLINTYRFDPAYTGINQFINYNPSKDINTFTSYFEWGFGVYWAFAEPKNK
jgi:hypothetical protein